MNQSGERALKLYQILKAWSDPGHLLAMPELLAMLEEEGISSDRRSVYRTLQTLKNAGFEIVYRRSPKQGYYLDHQLSVAEAVLLCDSVLENTSLSKQTSGRLCDVILSMLSEHQKEEAYLTPPVPAKTETNELTDNLSVLLKAIRGQNYVTFLYYDYTAGRRKQYRRSSRKYRLVPAAVIASSGRYYAVMYSDRHQSFASYRIDKMEQVRAEEEQAEYHPFDLSAWMQASFQNYRGEPETVIMQFDLSMANIVFDEFGYDILITSADARTFTAAIRTGITPTLIAWILQFQDRITIIKPQSLIARLLDISEQVINRYGGKNEREDRKAPDHD